MNLGRKEAKEDFVRRIRDITRREFIDRLPVLGRLDHLNTSELETVIIQNDGTGPATVEYRLGATRQLIAKLFQDASGLHSYRVLRRLWQGGFDKDRYQVPQPYSFLDEENLMLMAVARGDCLAAFLSVDSSRARAGVEAAARWLLRLHRSSIRMGRTEQPWYMFLKMADRLSKASEAHPGMMKFLTEKVDRFAEALASRSEVDLVQTHGQFRPIHVFLDGDTVTVIDVDRSGPADPARDVAEFVHRMRSTFRRESGDREQAAVLTRAFLREYSSGNPEGLRNLPFYLSFHVLVSLCRHMKRLPADDPGWDEMVGHYCEELKCALSGPGIS